LQNGKRLETPVETIDSLEMKMQLLEKQRGILLTELQADTSNDCNRDLQNTATSDPLDSYMLNVSSKLTEEKRSKLKNKLAMLDKERSRLSKLIELSRPALEGLKKKTKNATITKTTTTTTATTITKPVTTINTTNITSASLVRQVPVKT